MGVLGDVIDLEERKEYFDSIISCQNPNANVEVKEKHPCETKLSDVDNLEEDLAELINRVQRHTSCRKNSCLKRNKNGSVKCRYKLQKII